MTRVRIDIDRVVHLHLQNQVGAALKIEPQMNAVLHGMPASRWPVTAFRKTEDAEQKHQQSGDGESELPTQILIHNASVLTAYSSLMHSLERQPGRFTMPP